MKSILKLKYYFFLLFFATFLNDATAQRSYVNKEWQKREGILDEINANIDEYVTPQSVTDNAGNLYVVSHERNSNGNADILTVKYDRQGNTVWRSLFDFQGQSDYGTQLTLDNAGNVLVCGATNISNLDFDFIIVKYDASGNELWHQSYNGPGNDLDVPIAITKDNVGNIFVTGASQGSTTQIDYCTIKYDEFGNFQWEHRYDFASSMDIPSGIIVNSDGDVFVTGGSGSSFIDYDFTTLILNANGVLQSVNRIQNAVAIDKPAAMKRDNSGNIYIVGSAFNTSTNSYDEMIVKYDPNFIIEWVRKYDADGLDDAANSLDFDLLGNVYVGGYIKRTSQGKNFSLLKYDASGNLLWQIERDEQAYQSDDEIKRIKVSSNGYVALIGEITKSVEKVVLVMAYDMNGNRIWEKELASNTGNGYDEKACDISINNFGELYVVTKEEDNGAYKTTSSKVTELKIDKNIVYDANSGEALYYANQILVKFNPDIVNIAFVDKRDLTFEKLGNVIPSSLVQSMSDLLGVDLFGASVTKVYTRLTTEDNISTTRLGNEVDIPEFWATLLVHIPNAPERVSDDMSILSEDLKTISEFIFDAHPNHLYQKTSVPNDPLYGQSASLHPTQATPNASINAEPAWDRQVGRDYVKVGVFDEPILWSHEDFGDGTFSGSKISGGWNFVANQHISNTTEPNSSHGTATAGIIGAYRNNNIGIAGIAGGDWSTGNPGVQLFSMGIFNGDDEFGNPIFAPTDIVADAIVEGAASSQNFGYGFHIQNHSWSGGQINGSIKDAVLFAGKNDCIVIAARGNYDSASPRYPACLRDRYIINVGASGSDGTYKRKDDPISGTDQWYGSSYGLGVDFIAPGSVSIVAAPQYHAQPFVWNDANGQNQCSLNSTIDYSCFSGTSSSAPHVSGVAALLYSEHNVNNGYPNNLSTEDVEEILQWTATDIAVNNPPIVYPVDYDDYNGWGRINAGAAFAFIEPHTRIFHNGSPSSITFTPGNVQTVVLHESMNGIAVGTYTAIRYDIIHTYIDVFPSSTAIWGWWERAMDATGLSAENPITNYPYCTISSANVQGNTATITMKTFCWFIVNSVSSGQEVHAFIPALPQNVKTAYSLYLHDPEVGINDISGNETVGVYPNPANNELNVSMSDVTGKVQVSIFDFTGRIVLDQSFQNPADYSIVLNTENFSSGAYICKITNNKTVVTRKFLKQ